MSGRTKSGLVGFAEIGIALCMPEWKAQQIYNSAIKKVAFKMREKGFSKTDIREPRLGHWDRFDDYGD